MPPSTPEKFGRYTIEEELGRGTMGVVYRAFDPVLGRAIALKTIHFAHTLSKRRRASFEQRFLTEARVAAQLQHPGIVVVHDLGRDEESGDLFIALELLEGENLDDWIDGERRPEWRESLRIVARVAEALDHAHTRGVVHRDIKPANIMVLTHGQPKIMDFGIAKMEEGHLTSPGELFGTPLYMSPEQALGKPAGPRSDLFSLGSIAYSLLTGHPPFRAPDVPGILTRVVHLAPPPPSESVPGLPGDADYFVARAMAKDPEQRYANGRAMAEDADDIREGQTPRHRNGWQMPERGDATVMSRNGAFAPPAGQEEVRVDRRRAARAASRRRSALWFLLFLSLVALAFYRDPGLKAFWRTLAVQAGLVGAPAAGPAATPMAPPPLAAALEPTASPVEAASSPLATPPGTPLAMPAATPTPLPTASPTSTPAPTPAPTLAPTPSPTPSPAPRASPAPTPLATRHKPAPTRPAPILRLSIETRTRSGSLRVWVDERLALTAKLDGRTAPPLLRLTPGTHDIRVQVRTAARVDSAYARAAFSSGQTRRLGVRVTRGEVSLHWR